MAAPRVCAAYIFAYAYVIRSTRDTYCDNAQYFNVAIHKLRKIKFWEILFAIGIPYNCNC